MPASSLHPASAPFYQAKGHCRPLLVAQADHTVRGVSNEPPEELRLVPDPQPASGQPPRQAWMEGNIEARLPQHMATWLDQVGRGLPGESKDGAADRTRRRCCTAKDRPGARRHAMVRGLRGNCFQAAR